MFKGFHVNYTLLRNLQEHVEQSNMWIYNSVAGEKTASVKIASSPSFNKRFFLNQGMLNMIRPASEPMDTDWEGCGPRCELVAAGHRIPKNTNIHTHFSFSLPSDEAGFRAIILQFMDHAEGTGRACPLFQLEIRDRQLCVRWSKIKNGAYSSTSINPICDVDFDPSVFYDVDIYACFSATAGLVRVYLNDEWQFELTIPTATKFPKPLQLQYGVYGTPGVKLHLGVRRVYWERCYAIPHTNSLVEKPKQFIITGTVQGNKLKVEEAKITNLD